MGGNIESLAKIKKEYWRVDVTPLIKIGNRYRSDLSLIITKRKITATQVNKNKIETMCEYAWSNNQWSVRKFRP